MKIWPVVLCHYVFVHLIKSLFLSKKCKWPVLRLKSWPWYCCEMITQYNPPTPYTYKLTCFIIWLIKNILCDTCLTIHERYKIWIYSLLRLNRTRLNRTSVNTEHLPWNRLFLSVIPIYLLASKPNSV
jgi:hypothetical protein